MNATIWSILPPVIAIVLALITKEVYMSLLIGILSGALLYTQCNVITTIETTFQLVDVIKSALPAKVLSSKGHPAKRVFQAIRIEVNQELESLKKAIKQSIELLKPGGYCVVITFHSLEDRIVKKAFNEVSKPKKVDKRVPQLEVEIISYEHLTTQVILPTQKELEENPRSQSAKLRILRRKQEI